MFRNKLLSMAWRLKELILVIGFVISVIAQPFSPGLEINYEKSDYFVNDYVEGQEDKNPQSIFTLILSNKSGEQITDLEVELRGVVDIHSIGGKSSSIRINEEISKYVEFDKRDKYKIFFKNADSIPAGHNVQIQIIGSFLNLLIEDRLNVTSSAKKQSITEMSKITGIWVFMYSQSTTLFAILVAALILLGLKRFYEQELVK